MSKIAIVTDSTAAFPYASLGDIPVVSVPLNLIWGSETLKDGIEIQPSEFYQRLEHSTGATPTTSQPSPKEFLTVFESLLAQDYEIICLVISGALSGTFNSAVQAVHILGNVPVEVIDTKVTSVLLDLIINEVGIAIHNGATLAECVSTAESAMSHSRLYFTVNTLEFLIRGGRLSVVAGAAASLLNIRPILTLQDGRIVSKDKTRTFAKATRMLKDKIISDLEGKKLVNLAGAFTDNNEFVHKIMHEICQELNVPMPDDNYVLPLSPVIGCHIGPGAFGIGYLLADND